MKDCQVYNPISRGGAVIVDTKISPSGRLNPGQRVSTCLSDADLRSYGRTLVVTEGHGKEECDPFAEKIAARAEDRGPIHDQWLTREAVSRAFNHPRHKAGRGLRLASAGGGGSRDLEAWHSRECTEEERRRRVSHRDPDPRVPAVTCGEAVVDHVDRDVGMLRVLGGRSGPPLQWCSPPVPVSTEEWLLGLAAGGTACRAPTSRP